MCQALLCGVDHAAGRYGDARIGSRTKLRARGSLHAPGWPTPISSITCPYGSSRSSHPQPAGAVASRLQQTAAAGFRQSRSHVITMPAMPRSRAATALFSASSAIRASSVLMCSRQVRDLLEVETGQIPDPYLSVR